MDTRRITKLERDAIAALLKHAARTHDWALVAQASDLLQGISDDFTVLGNLADAHLDEHLAANIAELRESCRDDPEAIFAAIDMEGYESPCHTLMLFRWWNQGEVIPDNMDGKLYRWSHKQYQRALVERLKHDAQAEFMVALLGTRLQAVCSSGEETKGTLAQYLEANAEDEALCAMLMRYACRDVGAEMRTPGPQALYTTWTILIPFTHLLTQDARP